MAALQTLREKAGWFISGIIGLALLAFVVNADDLQNWFGANNNVIGKIEGEKIKLEDYQSRFDELETFTKMNTNSMSLTENQQNQIREQVWQQMIQEKVFGKIYENAGIAVTGEEILDMVTGNHISTMIQPLFTNQETGMYDRAMANNFLINKNKDAQALFYWSFVEKNLINSRLEAKYLTLLQKSVYCTDAQVKAETAKRSQSADIEYVAVRYTSIPDSIITVSEASIKEKYKKDKESYKTDASRDIEYVSFPIKPTEEDRNETIKLVEDLKVDFENTETNAYRFAQMNAETPSREIFLNESQLSSTLKEFVKSAKVGEVYGPYREGDSYKISRLVAVEQRPDSVKASHILVTDAQLADSLYNVVKKGGNFAEIARQYSEDNGSAINGGDLDWFSDGMMVPTFNEACFTGKKGDIVKVESQYGIHIIKIDDKGALTTKYSIATIDKSVQYSQKTYQSVYNDANAFLSNIKTYEDFTTMIDSMNLVKRYAQNIRTTAQTVNSIKSARELVKWAYKAKLNEVSDIFECGDEFIVATLVKEQEKGYANINDVAQMIKHDLSNELKTTIISTNNKDKSLEEIASAYNTKVDSASNINFASNSIMGAGIEPALVGKIIAAEQGKVCGAIKGNNAAYFFRVNNKTESEVNAEQIKQAYLQQLSSLSYYVSSMVINNADVEDNRIKFY